LIIEAIPTLELLKFMEMAGFYILYKWGGKEPISFDVNLTGVKDFRIRLFNNIDSYWHRGYACLADVQLYQ